MAFSHRLPSGIEPNALTRAIDALHRSATPFIDLTQSNPTRVGLPYPADLLAGLADPRALVYEPHPFGLAAARAAVAGEYRRRGARVDAEDVVLTASTSEAYTWLFKLLCDPGDAVLVPRPSYPLFDHLTALEGVLAAPYDLEYHGRWTIDVASIERAPPRTRAVVLVSPNNPTGSYVTATELDRVTTLCRARGWALVVDEVFADYPLEAAEPVTDVAATARVLAFTLGGASKSLGLPQVKLGWIVAGGPRRDRDAALRALAFIADAFLSVGTPVQLAAPQLLRSGEPVRQAIQARLRTNLQTARRLARHYPACDLLRVEGGWSAVLRVPSTRSEEQLVLDLLRDARVLAHPGYFFDFPREAYLVVSLLCSDEDFAAGFTSALRFIS
jgi:hypothetical protein